VELYLHSPNTPSWLGAQLKRRDFTFAFYLLKLYSDTLVYDCETLIEKESERNNISGPF
jgi:hypothetical protein